MMKKILIFFKAIRVKSYVKNLFIFVAMFFSKNLNNFETYRNALIAFFAFCLISSSVYLFNDIIDIKKDRLHPTKKLRPIAAGDIKVGSAIVASIIFLIGSLLLSYLISTQCLVIIIIYLLINILYTLVLKKHALFDVYSIAVGFVLRVLIGAYAINVEVSNYLLVTVLTLSLFLGFAKRYSEAKSMEKTNDMTRESLKGYSVKFLNSSLWAMMILTCLFYTLWTIDSEVIARIGSNNLVFTVPIVLIGFLEYLQVLDRGGDGDPVSMVYRNKKLIAIVILFLIVITFIYYF